VRYKPSSKRTGVNHLIQAAVVATFCAVSASHAMTPLDTSLPEDKITTIECEYDGNDSIPALGKADRGTYHYKVCVPMGYTADSTRRFPCMFIMSPGGNANLGHIGQRLKLNGWIVIMAVEARNGPWGPVIGNLCAAHDDAVRRLRIAENQKFATGFSGGARGTSTLVYLRRGFAGWCPQGAGPAFDNNHQYLRLPRDLAICASFGSWDRNLHELSRICDTFSNVHFEIFDAGHANATADVAERGMDWLEGQLFLNSPLPTVTTPQAARFFQRRYENLQGTTSGWTQYHRTAVLTKVATKYNLAAQPEIGPLATSLAALLRQMEVDPVVQAEKAAHNQYLAAQTLELREQTQSGTQKHGAPVPAQALAAYKEIARQYPAAEYGRLAATRVSGLSAGPPPKTKEG